MRNDKRRLDRTVGLNIRRERELRKISRDELAEILDLTVSHLGLIERGERGATSVTLEKLVKVFGVSIDSLFAELGKGISARENRVATKGIYRKKVESLVTFLTEMELEMLSHTIKGLVVMRKANASSDAAEQNEALANLLD